MKDVVPYNPLDNFDDDGSHNKLYEIRPMTHKRDIVYDNMIQKTSHIQANIVAIFEEWLLSFFPSDYFKTVRLTTQSSFADFKSFMKDIYKKNKPILVIDVEASEHVEDSLFGLNVIPRYNMIDPRYDVATSKILYSIELLSNENFELRFRRNRYRFSFDILYMVKSRNNQLDLYTFLLSNMRHNSKFTIERQVLNLIPLEYIHNMAISSGFEDYKDPKFLTFLNTFSRYPIINRVLPSGHWTFYMQQNLSLYFTIPDLPRKDSPEKSAAYEKGARVTHNVVIEADLPSEFIFLTPIDRSDFYIAGKDKDPDNIYYIAPELSFPEIDFDTPLVDTNGTYIAINKMKVMIEDESDNTLNILEDVVKNVDTNLYETIKRYIKATKGINNCLKVVVYRKVAVDDLKSDNDNGVSIPVEDDGTIMITDPNFRELYMIVTYVNMLVLNNFLKMENTEYIGTIEKY